MKRSKDIQCKQHFSTYLKKRKRRKDRTAKESYAIVTVWRMAPSFKLSPKDANVMQYEQVLLELMKMGDQEIHLSVGDYFQDHLDHLDHRDRQDHLVPQDCQVV